MAFENQYTGQQEQLDKYRRWPHQGANGPYPHGSGEPGHSPVDEERRGFTPQDMTPKSSEGTTNPRLLISFDIDGTMEFGDPPGQIAAQWVRLAKEQGNLVGSASDRPLAEQRRVWAQTGIELDFVILKHWMLELRTIFQADEYWHIGDGQMDQLFAQQAGFTFFLANTVSQDMFTQVNGQNGFDPPLPKS